MSVKTDTPEQHRILHRYWPPPHCCLCNYEVRIKELEEAVKKLEDKIATEPLRKEGE